MCVYPLVHGDGGTKVLHGGDDLLGVLLWYGLLHHLGRALDKLLGVDQAEAEQVLDLLDDLGLGRGVELLELEVEERLLGGGGRSLLGLLGRSGGGGGTASRASGEAADGQVRDVEPGL